MIKCQRMTEQLPWWPQLNLKRARKRGYADIKDFIFSHSEASAVATAMNYSVTFDDGTRSYVYYSDSDSDNALVVPCGKLPCPTRLLIVFFRLCYHTFRVLGVRLQSTPSTDHQGLWSCVCLLR